MKILFFALMSLLAFNSYAEDAKQVAVALRYVCVASKSIWHDVGTVDPTPKPEYKLINVAMFNKDYEFFSDKDFKFSFRLEKGSTVSDGDYKKGITEDIYAQILVKNSKGVLMFRAGSTMRSGAVSAYLGETNHWIRCSPTFN